MTISPTSTAFHHLVAIRRDLHQHPELAWQEERTSNVVAARLTELGIPHRRLAGTGIVADLPGETGIPAVALRADMDALPVHEETGLSFASVHENRMHACGHDGHMAILLGAAELLAGRSLPAPVRLLFQPAEELGEGAKRMIAEGALDGVGIVFGGHIDRGYDPGTLVVTDGCVNASTDEFYIELHGPGGHGARPHETVDPLVVGSLIVAELQTVVTRTIDPTRPAVLSVGQFHAGSAPNVIATTARLDGTLRAQDPTVRTQLQDGITRVVTNIAAAHGVTANVRVVDGTPAVINHGESVALAREAAAHVVGAASVVPMTTGNMGGEDFGFYLERLPGAFIRFGARPEGESFPAHSSRFWWDERVLAYGANWMEEIALRAGAALRSRGPQQSRT